MYGVGFYPVFRVVDLATGKDFIYDGFYTLKVIAVTDSPTNEPRWFTEEEIVRYNNMNQYAQPAQTSSNTDRLFFTPLSLSYSCC